MSIQNRELLANAVIEQAAVDYRKALCDFHKYRSKANLDRVDNLERFFKGDLFKIYTNLDGPTLMKKIKRHAAECNFDIRKINKDVRKNKPRLEEETIEY